MDEITYQDIINVCNRMTNIIPARNVIIMSRNRYNVLVKEFPALAGWVYRGDIVLSDYLPDTISCDLDG